MGDSIETRREKGRRIRQRCYPEVQIDHFSRLDSAVEFYLRVGALVTDASVVLDFGAGRAHWFVDSPSETRRRLRDLRPRVTKVIGMDVDPVVLNNPTLDEAHVVAPNGPFPLPDHSVDVIVSDFTFEHIDDPNAVGAEFDRMLKPGGWICARTPNRRGYIGLAARAISNQHHVPLLTRLQPGRKAEDVFPVRYRLNTPADIARYFRPDQYHAIVYAVGAEPAYAGSSRVLWWFFRMLTRVQPDALQPMLLIFLQKRS